MNNLEELILKGQTHIFKNNSEYTQYGGPYSRASDELLGWAAQVEHFILENYGEDSGPYKLYKSFDRRYLTGFEEDKFKTQLNILLGSLKACRDIEPNKKRRSKDDNVILSLIKNPLFWAVIVVLTGGAFGFGLRFGSAKFDNEKSDLYDENKILKNKLIQYEKTISQRDSIIILYKQEIKK